MTAAFSPFFLRASGPLIKSFHGHMTATKGSLPTRYGSADTRDTQHGLGSTQRFQCGNNRVTTFAGKGLRPVLDPEGGRGACETADYLPVGGSASTPPASLASGGFCEVVA